MKKLLFVALSLLVSGVMFSQTLSVQREIKTSGINLTRTGTAIVARTYANSQLDTTMAYDMANYEAAYVTILATDTIDVSLGYLPSYDGVNFQPKVVIASLTSVVAAGNVLSIALPAGAMGCPRVQLTFTFAGSANGVIGPTTYSAKLIRKR